MWIGVSLGCPYTVGDTDLQVKIVNNISIWWNTSVCKIWCVIKNTVFTDGKKWTDPLIKAILMK